MKLNFKQRTTLISILACWPIFGLFLSYIDIAPEITGFVRFLLYALAALLLSVILNFLLQTFSPATRAQNAIMIELETNGETQHFIELTEQEINRLITSNKAYKFYRFFSQYILLQADAYIMQHNPQAAIQSINRLNLQDMQTHLKGHLSMDRFLGYFDVHMAISEELKDAARANAVMQDAGPYLQKVNEKNIGYFIIANEIHILYFLSIGNPAKAYEYARKYFEHSGNRFCSFLANAYSAKIFTKTGQFTDAERFLQNASQQTTSTPNQRQILAYLREDLNRARNGF